MISFYEDHHKEYFNTTVALDSTPFLAPFTKRLPPGATILDVGCGSGRDLYWLVNQGFMPTGFELSPGLARLARDYSGQPVIQSDFTNFEFSTLGFDAILLIGSLVHLEHDKFPPVFLQICKALKETGLVLLSMKVGIGKYTSQDGRIFSLWPSEQLCEVVSASNFDILDFMRVGFSLKANETWLTYILKKPGE